MKRKRASIEAEKSFNLKLKILPFGMARSVAVAGGLGSPPAVSLRLGWLSQLGQMAPLASSAIRGLAS